MVEFLVVASIVTALLVIPWDDKPGSDAVIVHLLKAIRTAFAKFLGALSVPV
jgi:hypothetical protein